MQEEMRILGSLLRLLSSTMVSELSKETLYDSLPSLMCPYLSSLLVHHIWEYREHLLTKKKVLMTT
jgi:hypothetical protein